MQLGKSIVEILSVTVNVQPGSGITPVNVSTHPAASVIVHV